VCRSPHASDVTLRGIGHGGSAGAWPFPFHPTHFATNSGATATTACAHPAAATRGTACERITALAPLAEDNAEAASASRSSFASRSFGTPSSRQMASTTIGSSFIGSSAASAFGPFASSRGFSQYSSRSSNPGK
jgi:hypothetical protein